MTLLRCQHQQGYRTCGRFLGQVPTPAEFAGIVDHTREASEDAIVVQCRECGSWNVFEPKMVEEAA